MPPTINPEIPDHRTVRDGFERLTPDATPAWGTLDATGMLEHCARFNELYLGTRKPSLPVRIIARLFGGMIIKKFVTASPFELERNMSTMPDIRIAANDADPGAFEATRDRVLATLDDLDGIAGEWDHPLYGRIDAEIGKAMARGHATHHLYQFGLLGDPDEEG